MWGLTVRAAIRHHWMMRKGEVLREAETPASPPTQFQLEGLVCGR